MSKLPPDLDKAIRTYGHQADGVAHRYGLDGITLLRKLATGESGGRSNAVSSAGARSWLQFMPTTRTEVMRRYGLDPWRSPAEAVQAAILHLQGKVTGHAGLEGYNPGGGQAYVKYILDQPVGGPAGHRPSARSAPGPSRLTSSGPREDIDSALLDSLLSPHKPGSLLKSTVRRLDSGAYNIAGGAAVPPSSPAAPAQAGRVGRLSISGSANRAGVNIDRGLLSWLGSWAGSVGGLEIGTGTNHNQFVVGTHRESDHWTGHAVDIPASGRRGDEIAMTALLQLGVPQAQAARFVQNGGIYNVTRGGHRYQVIWKTNEGGNHYNHVHIGRR